MEELFITEEDLDYFTNIPGRVCEEEVLYKSKRTFEEEVKAHNCITLEEFGKMWKDSIDNDPRFI